MAFDGITVAALVCELQAAVGGRITKITQPEGDELLLTIKKERSTFRLFLSASASLPLVYLTEQNKPGPMTAPNFCMLLRKHLAGGRILSVSQPGLERVIQFEIEHLDEMGDVGRKLLMVEIMGKHSNIIFCDTDGTIIDSIKHISANVSSVREVLPGRPYFIPQTREKADPFAVSEEEIAETCLSRPLPLYQAIYQGLTGISPLMAEEVCARAGLDGGVSCDALSGAQKIHLARTFLRLIGDVREASFAPVIIYKGSEPVEFSAFPLLIWQDARTESFASISRVLETYYAEKNQIARMRQKSADLRHIAQTALERDTKKYQLQSKQLADTEKKEKYRVWGELLHTYGYQLEPGMKSCELENYYTGETIRVPLDPDLTPIENANRYFERYGKLKRTAEAMSRLLVETKAQIDHLQSILTSLDIAGSEGDLAQIREEMEEYGFVRRKGSPKKRQRITSRPLHYLSSDGFDIYVGKNNYQNEELSFRFATGGDWWFHAKGRPGSHVIVRTNGKDVPDRTFEEAGRLAGYYSSGRQAPKVEIDYTRKKNLRKPNGAKPGFVVYYTNYSLLASPDITGIRQAQEEK